MTGLAAERSHDGPRPVWVLALSDNRYDRRPVLTEAERAAVRELAHQRTRWPEELSRAIARLTDPIDDVLAVVTPQAAWWGRGPVRRALVAAMATEESTFWAWDRRRWLRVLRDTDAQIRQLVLAVAYLVCGQRDLHLELRGFKARKFAGRVFDQARVDAAIGRVQTHMDGLGHPTVLGRPILTHALMDMMLLVGSPLLQDLGARADLFAWLRSRELNNARRHGVEQLARTLVEMGVLSELPFRTQPSREEWLARSQAGEIDVPEVWLEWTRRWFETSTLSRSGRTHTYYALIKAGRWLYREHPDRTDPGSWDRQLVAGWIATVDGLNVGELSKSLNANYMRARHGGPLSPRSKAHLIWSLRTFFRDIQEWEWIGRRFDPRRAFALPRSISALIGPDPRVISDEVWAKLMWAGLNLTTADLPRHGHPRGNGKPWYPLELVRAVALLWLFAGLRVDEILRLPVGAIRWQHQHDREDRDQRVCLLDVPTNKTGTAFTKPVDRTVGDAIHAWEAVRPPQPRFEDRKTGEPVDVLLAYRGARIGEKYVNQVVIPLLCRKAGVPREDVRGQITGHRARATIASQLYNAKDPMTLFELQAWLGHSSPHSTQHYARITPVALTKAYQDAGYFARNVRTIEVLLDRDAITSGAAATGGPFEFYDLGHGYCTYAFFEQCPHRMACARCDFYIPKPSSQAQLLEAKDGLQRMLVQIPLTDEERGAVESDHDAVEKLINGLRDTATPAGPTPRELIQDTNAVPGQTPTTERPPHS
jgi:site-specific recombinase XerD